MKYKIYKGKNYNIHTIKTEKFKTCAMEIIFRNTCDKHKITEWNFLIDMLMYSSKRYPTKRDVAVRVEELYSASIRGLHNRIGNTSIVTFSLDFLNPKYCEEGYLEEVLKFPIEMLLEPNIENKAFDKKSFKIIKNRMKRDIDALKENANRYAFRQSLKAMDEESITASSMLGTKEELNKITEESLVSTYKQLIKDFTCDIYVIGNLDMDKVVSYLEENFKINPSTQETNLYVENKEREIPQDIEETGKYEQSSFLMIYNLNNLTKRERDYVIHIYNIILGSGSLTSKLYQYIREENSLCYNVSSMYQKYDQLLFICAGIDAKNKERTQELAEKAVNEMAEGKFTKKEIENAIKTIISSIKMNEDSMGSIINNYFFHELDKLPLYEERIKEFNTVTKEEIIAVANKVKLNTVYLLKGEEQ